MFSSNQILQISGNLAHKEELSNTLDFALKLSNHNINKYAIGWGYKECPKGWKSYDFIPTIDILSLIIKQFLENQTIKSYQCDGTYDKGFLIKSIEETFGDSEDGVKNAFYGIITIEPYTCFYSK